MTIMYVPTIPSRRNETEKRLSENDLLTEIVKKLRQEVTEIHLTSILHAGPVRSL